MMNIEKINDQLMEIVFAYGPRLAAAIATLIIGWWIIGMIGRTIRNIVKKRNVDVTLSSYLTNMTKWALKALLIVSVLGMLGIEMTSFIAILGAAGLAVGLALSGTLQNFASGIMILLFKPFKAGDFVEAGGHSGTVNEIQIFNTILKTPDNVTIIVPNNDIAGKSVKNYSMEDLRRVDMSFGIGYDDDIDAAKAILSDLITRDERTLSDPAPFISVSELADSSVNFVVRVWSKKEDYWGIYMDMQEAVKKAFDEKGVSIPYPQTDVHVHNS